MDAARNCRYPQLSWLGFHVSAAAVHNPLVVGMQGTCCTISLTRTGHHDVRWVTRGREQRWREYAGTIHFVPADDEQHTFVTRMSADFSSGVLAVPRRHFLDCLREEGHEPRRDLQRLLVPDDAVLRCCAARVLAGLRRGAASPDGDADEAARRLILRLIELSGGGRPDWHDDASLFDRHTLALLVAHIDAHRRVAPSLSDMASLVGLSPSHFAKKFRGTTGLSLHRFVNRRRIAAALTSLQDRSQPLAHVALDLGFSSQSHFTRLFSDLTGMTPAKYRRQFRRTVG